MKIEIEIPDDTDLEMVAELIDYARMAVSREAGTHSSWNSDFGDNLAKLMEEFADTEVRKAIGQHASAHHQKAKRIFDSRNNLTLALRDMQNQIKTRIRELRLASKGGA